ncbi:MAG: acetyl-CoA synthetase [Chloroflexi bacterium]|nr:acetyl-CoA synthetase [Chloroflexota bacterium]
MNLRQQLDFLFNPGSVAVIGASNNMEKWGFNILTILLLKGGRRVYAVNRNEAKIQGLDAYKNLTDIPEPVELAVITVPFRDIPAAMKDCVIKGVKAAVVVSGGLAETGDEGAEVEKEVVKIARSGGIRFIGPNCMGNFDTSTNLFTVPYLPQVKKGPLAVITQSGNVSQTIIYQASGAGLGFSKYISSGNEADLHFEDYLEYVGQDKETQIILGYVEGLREGRRFFKLAREITKRKPVVILKAGRTEAGAIAARSHTASLAGSDVVSESAFKQAGVIRVDEIEELVDMALILLGQPKPRGRRVGVYSTGGGAAVITADALMGQGLRLPALSPGTMSKLNSLMSGRWSRVNPVETGGDFFDYNCVWPLIEDDNFDATVVIGGGGASMNYAVWVPISSDFKEAVEQWMDAQEGNESREMDKLMELRDRYRKPVILANMGIPNARKGKLYKKLEETHLLHFPTPERAAKALARLVEYSEYLGIAK